MYLVGEIIKKYKIINSLLISTWQMLFFVDKEKVERKKQMKWKDFLLFFYFGHACIALQPEILGF